jgi:protein-S-isoprenylcysteine O-methyltransferase Ste14
MVTPDSPVPAERAMVDSLLRDYHDARRREDQWRIPQILLALITPIFALTGILFIFAGSTDNATTAAALAVITGVAAALIAVEIWRWHRMAVGIANRIRTDYPSDIGLLMRDPL